MKTLELEFILNLLDDYLSTYSYTAIRNYLLCF